MVRLKWNMRVLVVLLVIGSMASAAVAADMAKVNINTAPAGELTTLNGVGDALAGRILEYRKANGPFQRPEDIQKVKGIGPAIWDRNKDRITVGQPAAKPEKPAPKKKK